MEKITESKKPFEGHVSLATVLFHEEILVKKLPIKKGGLLDMAPLKKEVIQDSVRIDLEKRGTPLEKDPLFLN